MKIKSLICVVSALCVLGNMAYAATAERVCWLSNANCCALKSNVCSETRCKTSGAGALCPSSSSSCMGVPYVCVSSGYNGFAGYVLCYDKGCPNLSYYWMCEAGFYSEGELETDENGVEVPDCFECDSYGLDNKAGASERGSEGVEACYIPKGEGVRDISGTYEYTSDCHYEW